MDIILGSLNYAAIWTLLHFLCNYALRLLQGKKYSEHPNSVQDYLCGCIVSIIMSFVAVYNVLMIGQKEGVGFLIYEIPMSFSSEDSRNVLFILMGYFAYDLPLTVYWRQEWPGSSSMIIHHVFGLISFVFLLVYETGHCCGLTAMLMECTNLFVNTRALLDKLGYKDNFPKLYLINGVGLTLSFFFARILYFTYAGYYVLVRNWDAFSKALDSKLQISIIIGYAIGQVLQYVWFVKIFQGFINVALRTFNTKEA